MAENKILGMGWLPDLPDYRPTWLMHRSCWSGFDRIL